MGGASERGIEVHERGYDDVEGTICIDHVDDDFLRAAAGEPDETSCSFCGRSEPGEAPFAVELQTLMPAFFDAFWDYYTRFDEAPYWDGESHGTDWADTAVYNIAQGAFAEKVEDAVLAAISEAIVDGEVGTMFTRMDTDDLSLAWDEFEEIARHVSRSLFLSSTSRAPLGRVASFLNQLLEYVDGDLNLVRTLPAGTPFYRGRLVEDIDASTKRSARDLGPAPARLAAANRMSPAGVPLFYGSADAATAVAEIASHSVKPFTVVGRFRALRELVVLDLTGAASQPSPFDTAHRREARMLSYFQEFVRNITRPVIPDDRVHVDYAPTQVLTEFLRWAPKTRLDGIALPSAQTMKPTFVLFAGPDDVDSTDEPREPGDVGSSALMNSIGLEAEEDVAFGPMLRLDSESVVAYRVRRRVELEEAGSIVAGAWSLPAPVRHL